MQGTLEATSLDLVLARPFGTARGASSVAHNVLVRLTLDGIEGLGEGAPIGRYRESQAAVIERVRRWPLDALRELARTPGEAQLAVVLDETARADATLGDPLFAARSALDMALHDWLGRREGVSLLARWGLQGHRPPASSYTIGLASPTEMADVAAAVEHPLLKVKLGGPDGPAADRQRVQAIRAVTERPICVDANEGWPSARVALEMIEWLSPRGVRWVEQPLPATSPEVEQCWLRERSPLPLLADEACLSVQDVSRCAAGYHGINVKLDKCGGLRAGRALIGAARAAGLRVLVGCMVSSSLAIGAGAILGLLADEADLDGHLLLAADPFVGPRLDAEGRLWPGPGPGIGVQRRPGA